MEYGPSSSRLTRLSIAYPDSFPSTEQVLVLPSHERRSACTDDGCYECLSLICRHIVHSSREKLQEVLVSTLAQSGILLIGWRENSTRLNLIAPSKPFHVVIFCSHDYLACMDEHTAVPIFLRKLLQGLPISPAGRYLCAMLVILPSFQSRQDPLFSIA
jgi:hypothetical protein